MIETSHKLGIPQTDQRDKWTFFRRGPLQLREGFTKKKLLFFWILSIKGVYFLQNANTLNFKLFFRLNT